MTAMATMTPARKTVGSGSHRAEPVPALAAHRRRFRLAAACYLGMVMLVALAIAMSAILPAAIGAPLFALFAAGVVVLAHPTIRITRRS